MEHLITGLIGLALLAASFWMGIKKGKKELEKASESGNEHTGQEDETSKFEDNYNFLRGCELEEEGKDLEAFDFFKKAIDDDSRNIYAQSHIADIYFKHGDVGTALKVYDNAIKIAARNNSAFLYVARAHVYGSLNNMEKCLSDCNTALDIDPEFIRGYEERASYYYNMKDHESVIRDIEKFITLDPHNPYGYMVKGRSLMALGKAKEALNEFQYAEALDAGYVPALSFQAEAYLKLGKNQEAITYEIRALEKAESDGNPDPKTYEMRDRLAKEVGEPYFIRLQAKVSNGVDGEKWASNLAVSLARSSHYSQAACWYEKAASIGDNPVNSCYAAVCWRNAGNYERALDLNKIGLQSLRENEEACQDYINTLFLNEMYDEAISECNSLIARFPDNSMCYYLKALSLYRLDRKEEALKNFSTAFALGNRPSALYYMGKVKSELEPSAGNEDLQKLIDSSDKDPERKYYVAMALCLTGKTEEGRAKADELESQFKMYNEEVDKDRLTRELLEVYCFLGDKEKALSLIEESLKQHFPHFNDILHSPEYKTISGDERFISLIEEYRKKAEKEWEGAMSSILGMTPVEEETQAPTIQAVSIPFTRENGICKVPCTINSLPLHFVFDTGASDISISSVEASFMLKNGYLKPVDLGGKEYYSTASGEIAEGTRIRLREVDFGGLKLQNVKASVIKNQQAPLLLGQTILERLGKIEIDNTNKLLKVISQA